MRMRKYIPSIIKQNKELELELEINMEEYLPVFHKEEITRSTEIKRGVLVTSLFGEDKI
jgi:hypothetical protein